MDLLRILITVSLILAIYIIYTWWTSTGGIFRLNTQYHVLGCYASDTITNYPSQIKEKINSLNSYEDQLENIHFNDLQWLDKLLPQLTNKLETFEKNYYESKADNVKSILVEKKLEDAIKEHEQCLARVSNLDRKDCEDVRTSEGQIKVQIQNSFAEIARLNDLKKDLEDDFQREKQRKPAPQPSKPVVISRDEEISRERTNLLNTKDRIRSLEKQKIILLEKIQTNKDHLDRCTSSRELAKICETITATLEQFVDEQYHLASIQERIDMKTKQFKVIKDAIEGCISNCDEANRQAELCRQQLVHLIKLQAELREKEAKCKQLCTKEEIDALNQERLRLEAQRARNAQDINDANDLMKQYEKKIRELELEARVIPAVVDFSQEPGHKLRTISNDLGNVFKDIKEKHSNIQTLLNTLEGKDSQFSDHARNLEILNECAVLREVAQKLAKQVDDLSRVPGLQNRIESSKSELISLLNSVRKS